jgi:hypothetical protein
LGLSGEAFASVGLEDIAMATKISKARKRSGPRRKKPLIPEPSPRFILWSGIISLVLLCGIVVLDYTAGEAGTQPQLAANK